jgi:hypothetical protein
MKFDGRLRWVCPHCGAVNSRLRFTLVHRDLGFELLEHRVFGKVILGYTGGGGGIMLVGDANCPKCLGEVSFDAVRDGFFRWLGRLKRKNPERYAEILSECLE